jgi:hypothetical protein
MIRYALVIGAASWLTAVAAAEDPTPPRALSLGGMRQAEATVTTSGDDYIIGVRFLAVEAFDAVTNLRLNREKGRLLTLQALARHLSERQLVQMAVSGAHVDKAEADGKHFAVTLRVPRKGVTVLADAKVPPAAGPDEEGAERVGFTSGLFRRKGDYAQTIQLLSADLRQDLLAAEKKAGAQGGDGPPLSKLVADLEAQAVRNFDKLAGEVEADLLLFSVGGIGAPSEQEELLDAIKRQKEQLRALVKETLKKHEEKRSAEGSP